MRLPMFFAAVLAIQIAYLIILRTGFVKAVAACGKARAAAPAAIPPVSVVVAARNEEATLPHLLRSLERQSHPEMEVVVVDDGSTDGTPALLRAREAEGPLRVVRVDEPENPRKKNALTKGISAARHEILAFTDADCTPPPRWAEEGAALMGREPHATLLIGYSPFRSEPGLLNRFSRYETFVTGYFTAAACGLGRPYMAVGRNLFYSKSLFDRTGGFTATLQSLSGDDDLFVQQVAKKRRANILHLFGRDTYVETDPPRTWRQWLGQKIRHTSAGRFYPRDAKLHLTLFHATSTLLWIAPVFAGWWGALFLGVRLVAHGTILREGAEHLAEQRIFPAQPFLEFLYVLYNIVVAPLGLIRIPNRW